MSTTPQKLGIHDVRAQYFTTKADYDGHAVVAHLQGNADMEAQPGLQILLDELDIEAQRLGAREVVIELHDLYFMNSSCLSLFVRWIGGLRERDLSKAYKIRFRSNPNLRWQRHSLRALSALAQGFVDVE